MRGEMAVQFVRLVVLGFLGWISAGPAKAQKVKGLPSNGNIELCFPENPSDERSRKYGCGSKTCTQNWRMVYENKD